MLEQFKKDIFVDDYACERIGNNRNDKALFNGFYCYRNPSLQGYLQREAWRENNQNKRAVYLVKEKNKIVMYFTLQCGVLVQCHKKEIGGIVHKGTEQSPKYHIDTENIEVTNSIPAIEMAQFCINDAYKRKKKSWKIPHGNRMYNVGAYCFYRYIAPKVIQLAEIAGLKYLYIFCADDGTGKLKDYYIRELHFEEMDDMACIRSKYDQDLPCMTIKIEDLIKYTDAFNDLSRK